MNNTSANKVLQFNLIKVNICFCFPSFLFGPTKQNDPMIEDLRINSIYNNNQHLNKSAQIGLSHHHHHNHHLITYYSQNLKLIRCLLLRILLKNERKGLISNQICVFSEKVKANVDHITKHASVSCFCIFTPKVWLFCNNNKISNKCSCWVKCCFFSLLLSKNEKEKFYLAERNKSR
jgi:hypothetical protein